MCQFSLIDFELTLINIIPPINDNIPKIYPAARIKDYKTQDLNAGRSIDNYIIKLLEIYNYRCIYCHIGLNYRSWTLDRIDNKIAYIYSNCVISCLYCNVNRKDMLFKQFYRLEALKRYDSRYPLIHIINEDNKIVYEKLKNNICGGLSLVFHRYHEKDKTYIQRCKYINNKWELDSKGYLVKNIVGFDANALYLWCLGQDMPCGKLQYTPKSEIDLNSIFGFLEVDIHVPEHSYNYFGEFPPIVKNLEYSNNICGEYTTTLLNNKFTKSRKLIATLKEII